jgi:hypothetical protein
MDDDGEQVVDASKAVYEINGLTGECQHMFVATGEWAINRLVNRLVRRR